MKKNSKKQWVFFFLIISYFSFIIPHNQLLKKLSKLPIRVQKQSFVSITTPEISQYKEYKKIVKLIESNIKDNNSNYNKTFLLHLEQAFDQLLKHIEKDKIFLFDHHTYQKPRLINSLDFTKHPSIQLLNMDEICKLQKIKLAYDLKILENFEKLDKNSSNYVTINNEDIYRWHANRANLDRCGIQKVHQLIQKANKEN